MAVQTVVDEGVRPALQRHDVVRLDRSAVEFETRFGAERERRHEREDGGE